MHSPSFHAPDRTVPAPPGGTLRPGSRARLVAVLCLAGVLAGCAGDGPPAARPDASGRVEVFGTIDAGVARTR